MENFYIQILENAKDLPQPRYMTAGASGLDLYANVQDGFVIKVGQRVIVPCGFKMALPFGYEAQIRARSGLALKHGIGLPNGIGTVDADYRGEIGVILVNFGENDFVINRGDRIAQMVVNKVEVANFTIVEYLPKSGRGEGGFGSTGI